MISRILIVLAALATLPGYIIASEKLATHSLEWAIAHDIVLGVAIVTLIWLLGLSVLFAWRKLQIKLIKTTEEARPGKFVRLVGDPIFDPNKGVYFNGAGEDGQMHKIVIEPKWWHLLPRSAISRDGEAEAAVLNGSYSSVLPGTEPSSLVMLKVGEVTVGFGSRVQYKGCSDYLLTAHHVVAPHAELNLCKRGLVVKLSEDILESTYESASEAVDFVMIKVPSNYWSKLGVGVGKLTTMTKRTTVTLYGGSNSMGLISSQGSAYKGRTGFAIIHEAPTTRGWSGTPLYQGNFIVGIHTGCGKLGETNCATNVNLLLELSSTQESNFSENSYSEIDEDNFVLRANREEYMEVEIKGKGKFLLGDADYINVTDKPSNWEKLKKARGEEIWEDAEDTEEQLDNYFKTSLVSWYNKGKETAAQFCKGAAEPVVEVTTDNLLESLNYQRVATSEDVVPPLSGSPSTSGSPQRLSPHGVCPSPTLEERVANLEKLLEKSLEAMCKMQLEYSQSLKSMAGLGEGAKQSLGLLHTKLEDLDRQSLQKSCSMPSEVLPPNTQELPSGGSSEPTTGAKKKSQKKRRKSGKRKSTQKPPLESPCQSWVKVTPKS
nr:polyprotein 2a [Solemoviridae sp.]